MSLSNVIQIAQNSLANMTRRSGVLARNVNDVGNENYARRDLQTITNLYGSQTSAVMRATDLKLEKSALSATSESVGQQTLMGGLDNLKGLLANENGNLIVSDRLLALNNSLQTYSSLPQNDLLGFAVIDKAKDMVDGLRVATTSLQDFRAGIDGEIEDTVSHLNSLLGDFETANNVIREGTQLGRDVNDALDTRSGLLKEIAKIIPVSSFTRSGNDMVLMTATGTTLFETAPRKIAFTAQNALAPGTEGNPVYVDFSIFSVGNEPSSSASGKLDALLRLRDSVAPALQRQVDEIARSLISDFAEHDVSGSSLAPLQGLFAWSGGPAFPTAGILADGLAGNISVNGAYDPEAGGSVLRLRDGGANGTAYLENPSGGSAFSNRLIELARNFDRPQPYDSSAGLGSSLTVLDFAGSSSAWFASVRSNAYERGELADAKEARIYENLANKTGVNIDLEMVKLGELEQGYEASARLLRAADQMLQDLLNAVG